MLKILVVNDRGRGVIQYFIFVSDQSSSRFSTVSQTVFEIETTAGIRGALPEQLTHLSESSACRRPEHDGKVCLEGGPPLSSYKISGAAVRRLSESHQSIVMEP